MRLRFGTPRGAPRYASTGCNLEPGYLLTYVSWRIRGAAGVACARV
ncbi:MAG: hypothetical protein ACYSUF_09470 [Planctomycetota bacterium]